MAVVNFKAILLRAKNTWLSNTTDTTHKRSRVAELDPEFQAIQVTPVCTFEQKNLQNPR